MISLIWWVYLQATHLLHRYRRSELWRNSFCNLIVLQILHGHKAFLFGRSVSIWKRTILSFLNDDFRSLVIQICVEILSEIWITLLSKWIWKSKRKLTDCICQQAILQSCSSICWYTVWSLRVIRLFSPSNFVRQLNLGVQVLCSRIHILCLRFYIQNLKACLLPSKIVWSMRGLFFWARTTL